MSRAISAIARSFANLIYPPHCISCGAPLEIDKKGCLCDICMAGIRANPKPHCSTCGRPTEKVSTACADCRKTKFYFTRACSAYIYDGPLKELIHLFKYNCRLSLAGPLANFMIESVKEDAGILKDTDVITFVPLDNRRLRERGFNQSKILASKISESFGIRLTDTLEKIRRTRRQNELSRDMRLKNLNGAFRLRRQANISGLRLLLIDDVMTTGSTLNECSRVLIESGAEGVTCLTLARGL